MDRPVIAPPPLRTLVASLDDHERRALVGLLHRLPGVVVASDGEADVLFAPPAALASAPERPEDQQVVVVARSTQDVLRAFELQAFDCLLWPPSGQRLAWILARARAARAGQPPRAHRHAPPLPERIALSEGGRITFVPVADIDWIEAAGNYALLHAGPRSGLLRTTLHDLEARLDARRFLRIHRSRIVNVARVRELVPQPSGDCEIVLKDGTRLMSSRSYREARRARLQPLAGS